MIHHDDLKHLGGICINFLTQATLHQCKETIFSLQDLLDAQDLLEATVIQLGEKFVLHIYATTRLCSLTLRHNTLELSNNLALDSINSEKGLNLEIVLSMARCPLAYVFPTINEFFSSIRIRFNAALAARKTRIGFGTNTAQRPTEFWTYKAEHGFVLNENVSLIEALVETTQPDALDTIYTFSCYRACEHVLLLAIALELAQTNPALFKKLEKLCRTKALVNVEFNQAFIHEHGTHKTPLPLEFYVPGDRVWFRNPDEYSSNIQGFEGSWVIYLGAGQFSNFWDLTKPVSLEIKCIEVFHWRHGAERKIDGEMWMNEPLVAEFVQKTLGNKAARQDVNTQMMKIRDISGTYADGGTIDSTRDEIRCVCPTTFTILI